LPTLVDRYHVEDGSATWANAYDSAAREYDPLQPAYARQYEGYGGPDHWGAGCVCVCDGSLRCPSIVIVKGFSHHHGEHTNVACVTYGHVWLGATLCISPAHDFVAFSLRCGHYEGGYQSHHGYDHYGAGYQASGYAENYYGQGDRYSGWEKPYSRHDRSQFGRKQSMAERTTSTRRPSGIREGRCCASIGIACFNECGCVADGKPVSQAPEKVVKAPAGAVDAKPVSQALEKVVKAPAGAVDAKPVEESPAAGTPAAEKHPAEVQAAETTQVWDEAGAGRLFFGSKRLEEHHTIRCYVREWREVRLAAEVRRGSTGHCIGSNCQSSNPCRFQRGADGSKAEPASDTAAEKYVARRH
jgi:hypothetical protein